MGSPVESMETDVMKESCSNSATSSSDSNNEYIYRPTTFEDLLRDIPREVLNDCGPDEAFRPDYKAAIFSQSRPAGAPFTPHEPSLCHDEEVMDDGTFYFESDHLALKGNEDYHNLLKVVVTLQALRSQAVKDLEQLHNAKKEALMDPIAYVEKLKNGDLPEYPGPLPIPEIPDIDFSKYKSVQPDENMRPITRNIRSTVAKKTNLNQQSTSKLLEASTVSGKPKVRGRDYDESKPGTFNQLWTKQEQERLQELLEIYPTEEIEMKRWTKIANALGTRTPKQVCSRVQKYFLKLSKVGLPIPGRQPKVKSDRRFSAKARQNIATKRSTFFPHEHLEDEFFHSSYHYNNSDTNSGSESIKKEYTCEPMHIQLLRNIKGETFTEYEKNYTHTGHKCYICNMNPIRNIRWECQDCADINLCTDCAVAQLEAEDPLHPPDHMMSVHRPPKMSSHNGYDVDYMPHKFNKGSYNYLDMNYIPE
ncbi:ZZ-type zinc finger-containing protein 3 [Trichogramma pretiosum]|uniref:ZZ-type zinc finger-containing protein 3 n=1 Tax=Trichogramma pretiosum TaxID=7493 RepID=UPI0006C99A98|nr:ZZ-type zinc finger-containing protein 3 [Trichogramma pretiosum]